MVNYLTNWTAADISVDDDNNFELTSVMAICWTAFWTKQYNAALLKVKRLKVPTFIYRLLQGNPGQQRLTIIRSGALTGSDTSGAAQVAAAHCPNERTLDPAVCS